jgi:hypothetical protein
MNPLADRAVVWCHLGERGAHRAFPILGGLQAPERALS